MKFSSLFAFAPLAALVTAIPRAKHVQAHQWANLTAGHLLPPIEAHHKGLGARQTPENSAVLAGFAGVDWYNGYNNNQAISGQVIVPSLTWRSDGPATQKFTVWVGIEGRSCTTVPAALAQAGLYGQVYSDGSMIWYAFYEWANSQTIQPISGFSVSAGDTLWMQIVLNSPTSATANLNNKSTGQTHSVNFSGPQICASDALWLIEDLCYTNGESNCVQAKFDEFYMTDALVIANNGYINAAAGGEITMSRNGQDYVHVGDSTSNIIFQYVGPN